MLAFAVLAVAAALLRADDRPAFRDITLAAGTGGPTTRGETGGHGVAFADVDRDGQPDLYVTMVFERRMADLFFRNLGRGRFADEGSDRRVDDLDGGSHGGCWADLDDDGDYDLVNGTTWPDPDAPNHNDIYRNDGHGHFTDVTPEALRGTRLPTRAILCFDLDADGDLDVFGVTNYQGSDDPPGEPNEVWRNDGGLRFTAIDAGELASCPAGQGATDTDFDGDGDIDVIAANRGGDLNVLRNDGKGNFTRIAPASIGIRHRAADGVTSADIDRDGDLDLLLTSADDTATLYRNAGGGVFALAQTFSDFDGYMGGFADLDNDGDLDLVFAGDDTVYWNDGASFVPGPPIPVSGIDDPRGIAFADIDGDGDVDFAIGAKRSRNWLVRNELATHGRWLKVELVAPSGQAGAFGAKVSLRASGSGRNTARIGFREARSNNGYLGQDDPLLHFGAGESTHVDLDVVFLDGSSVTHRAVATNQTVRVRGTHAWLADRIAPEWGPVAEWSIESSTHRGDPFDAVVAATFRHAASGEERTTPLYFDGDRAWRFRFTATRAGEWEYRTTSADPTFSARRGTVTVVANANPDAHGFVTAFGSKWGWQGTGRAFVPQLVMYRADPPGLADAAAIDRDIELFFHQHGFNGFHLPTLGARFFDHDAASERVDETMRDPDPRTFAALELVISRVHAAGGFTHIWAWGDDQRGQTPLRLRGGPDGDVARRLERYIAARLGPLPGWTMGFGFDLQEWAAIPDRAQLVRPWKERLSALLGWQHLLGGRMGPTLRDGEIEHDLQARLADGLSYSGYEHHRPSFAMYVAALEARPGFPVLSEDRFRIRVPPLYPDKDYDEEMTRRGLYRSTLAGGAGNIWGNNHPGGWGPGGMSRAYPRPEIIQTWARCFANRFTRDMERAAIADGPCLARPTRRHFVVYREDASSMIVDLSAIDGACAAVAIDTRQAYREIALGTIEPGRFEWKAPHPSDWILAIGDFDGASTSP